MKTLNQKLTALSPARRKKIATRAAVLIAEEMSLQELRQAHKLTQAARRKEAGHWSGGDLQVEKRTDLLISTLRDYVETMGAACRSSRNFRIMSQSLSAAWPR